MKICAYCKTNAKLTKEHIWPNTLLRKYQDGLKTYNGRTESYYTGDALIKDVCSECNNEKLSDLDRYLSTVYNDYFGRIVQPGHAAVFNYDYELLLRSLLKISYNSARAYHPKDSKIVKLHNQFSNFILDGGYHPKVMVRLLIVTASKMVDLTLGSEEMINPYLLRCTGLQGGNSATEKFMVRMLALNSFWFYLIVPYRTQPEHQWSKFENAFTIMNHLNGVKLERKSSKVVIPVEQTTWFDPRLLGRMVTAQ